MKAKRLNPLTGDWVFDDATRTWAECSPALMLAALAWTTPVGESETNPTRGAVDWRGFEATSPSAAKDAQRRLLQAIDVYVRDGRIADPVVTVEIQGRAVVYAATIRDPRDPIGQPLRGTITL